jgi:hypothetical protein
MGWLWRLLPTKKSENDYSRSGNQDAADPNQFSRHGWLSFHRAFEFVFPTPKRPASSTNDGLILVPCGGKP